MVSWDSSEIWGPLCLHLGSPVSIPEPPPNVLGTFSFVRLSLSVLLGAGLDVWKGWGGGTINHYITNCPINQPLIKLTTGAMAGFLLQPLTGLLLIPEAPCPGCLGVSLCCPEISQVAVVGTVACCCCGNLWLLRLLLELFLGLLLGSPIGSSWTFLYSLRLPQGILWPSRGSSVGSSWALLGLSWAISGLSHYSMGVEKEALLCSPKLS